MTSETTLRVRYAETDQMGVVYHANYLVWFEVGRVEFMRALGLEYRTLEREEGLGIAVVEANCRYRLPARYDDELTVRTRLGGVRGSVIRFGYELRRGDTLLAQGSTVHVVVDRAMRRAALPEKYLAAFRAAHVPVETTA